MKAKEELKELKTKTVAELKKILAQNRDKVRDLKFKATQNQLKNVREIRVLKKKIAKVLTFIKQKENK
ncbi:MAG: 50S ribosomal protein L29 [Candidatus Buchananbacteria bacterium RBG_13_36_9]|uniref:Large ribosomal subunit protein uL29 n=1 Tax=Candidatus Buchananbacteria bacterium RBG_13_36_9 TaxID=1797530 RepID=A0A1G1XN22_9BACT|nr:MAG: 50S ribosomal protein L29 [Candidatus Buchananbacteria bacterium RBG_13_36_9]